MTKHDDLIMTPKKARQWLDELVDDLGSIRHLRDEMRVPLEALAADTIECGVEYTFSGGAVETYWPHPSAATVDQVKVLDDVFGAPPGIAAMHEGETITRKRLMARRVSTPWEVGE